MLGSLKKFFGRKDEDKPAPPGPVGASPAASIPASPAATPDSAPHPEERGPDLCIKLQPILERLPEPATKLASSRKSSATVRLPANDILPKLRNGVVKIPFRILREAAPQGFFADDRSLDETPVEIPLKEVLQQVPPAYLQTRPNQKRREVPSDIADMFGPKGLRAPPPQPPAPAPETPAPAAPAPSQAPSSVAPAAAAQQPSASIRMPETATAPPPAGESIRISLSEASEAWPDVVQKEISQHQRSGAAIVLPWAAAEPGLRAGRLSFSWAKIRQWLESPPADASPSGETALIIPLNLVVPAFISRKGLQRKSAEIEIDPAIPEMFAKGAFAPPPVPEPAEAPLAAAPTPDVSASPAEAQTPAAAIPAAPAAPAQASPPSEEPAKPIPMPASPGLAAVAPAASPVPATTPQPAAGGSLGAIFGDPRKVDWSLKEIVQKTVELSGVSGALISMQDGLLAAAALPQGLKPETVAAFVPQIFGRLSQYSKELQFGKLTKVTLHCNGADMAIFKAGNVYFVAAGIPGQALPATALEVIAAELGKQQNS